MPDGQQDESDLNQDSSLDVTVRLPGRLRAKYSVYARVSGRDIEDVVLQSLVSHDEVVTGLLKLPKILKEEHAKGAKRGFKFGFSAGIVLTGAMYGILRLVRRK